VCTSSSLKWRGQAKNGTIPAHQNTKCSICRQGKGKHTVHPATDHEGPEVEYRYSSTLPFTSALYGGGQSMPRPLYHRGRPDTHCIGGWVGSRVGLDGCGKSRPNWIWHPDYPADSESLYWLNYPGPLCIQASVGKHCNFRAATGTSSSCGCFRNPLRAAIRT